MPNTRILSVLLAGALAACASAVPPPPPASEPAAPPVVLRAPAPAPAGVFLVFFEPRSAALDRPARGVIRSAVQIARAQPRSPLVVTGYASPAGTEAAGEQLSRQRARAVANALRAQGIPARRIRAEWRGPTGPVFDDEESRRVEVRVEAPAPR